ncbi:MAG: DUF4406 domain-containing protein [Bacteroidales bacterium]|nr:DUF4406 domain-containing protein [Bacteroidales bacterium]
MKKSRVYIAGRVGDVSDPNILRIRQANFERREKALARLGYKAVNPMKIVPQGTEWKDAMRICLKALCDCDCISLLPDWRLSEGATLEAHIAEELGIPQVYPSAMND